MDAETKQKICDVSYSLGKITGVIVRETSTILGIMTAIANPVGTMIINGVSMAGHRLFSAADPRGTHPDIYNELDSLKREVEILRQATIQTPWEDD